MSIVIPVAEANTAAATPLSVFADLRLETDGHRLHLVGDGQSLVVHTSDPRKLLRDVRHMSLPAQISGLAGRTALGRAADAEAVSGHPPRCPDLLDHPVPERLVALGRELVGDPAQGTARFLGQGTAV